MSEPEVKLRSPHERFCLADFESDLKKMDNSAKPTDTLWDILLRRQSLSQTGATRPCLHGFGLCYPTDFV